jgi:hypothetical protein
MKQVLLFLFVIAMVNSHAQRSEQEDGVKVNVFSAQFLVSTDLKAVYLNLVGSSIKYTHGNTSIAVGVFPTIRFYEDPHLDSTEPKKPFVVPGFSAGLLFSYKRFMLATPVFFKDDQWHFTVGTGVKIGPLK